MRASKLFLPTLREDPADAEAASHKLLVRGGFIRQVSAGLWTYLPLGWRVHQKVVQIIREEMNAIGGQEMLCPVLTPAELWERTGRIAIPEVFKLRIATAGAFVLPLTHEETMTFHAREIRSYKELPQIWYHFSTKERDEPRPRGGLLRVREFIMKDAYSFDRDEAGLDASFDRHRGGVPADLRALRRRRAPRRGRVRDHGRQGVARLPRSDRLGRERAHALRERRLLRRHRGRARDPSRPRASRSLSTRRRRSRRPAWRRSRRSPSFLGIDPAATSKAMPVVVGDRLVLALVRGDDRLSEEKLMTIFESAFRPATEEEIRDTFGADGGSIGPLGVSVEVIADEALREGQFVAGANRDGWHVRGVQAGRDYEPRFADIRQATEGDACPECGGRLLVQPAIEVGHIFKLGTFHSSALEAMFLDEDGSEKADRHG